MLKHAEYIPVEVVTKPIIKKAETNCKVSSIDPDEKLPEETASFNTLNSI
ncbi:MAG: hypothetical protein ABI760_03225 [Ferruginibacter sp.]